jgi:isoleucyl-tRNA synthetase
VASTDFRNDMAASKNILNQVREAYTKIRNTCRFLLSNLSDAGISDTKDGTQNVERRRQSTGEKQPETLLEVDRWILLRLQRLIERCRKAYDAFEFHVVYHALYDFCVNDLSAYYLDMSKDRLYCAGKNSSERCSAQFAIQKILLVLVRLMAPILPFTAENIHKYILLERGVGGERGGSLFLKSMPEVNPLYLDPKLEERWGKLLGLREEVYREIEAVRARKEIASSTEALVEIGIKGREWARELEAILPMVLIVSQVKLMENSEIVVRHAEGAKCERCWLWSTSVGKHSEHPTLCDRCFRVITG